MFSFITLTSQLKVNVLKQFVLCDTFINLSLFFILSLLFPLLFSLLLSFKTKLRVTISTIKIQCLYYFCVHNKKILEQCLINDTVSIDTTLFEKFV